MRRRLLLLLFATTVAPASAQMPEPARTREHAVPRPATVVLGRLRSGATVSFARVTPAAWGIEVAAAAAPRIVQDRPARLELIDSEGRIRELAAGYRTVAKRTSGIEARVEIAAGHGVVFHVVDQWKVSDAILS